MQRRVCAVRRSEERYALRRLSAELYARTYEGESCVLVAGQPKCSQCKPGFANDAELNCVYCVTDPSNNFVVEGTNCVACTSPNCEVCGATHEVCSVCALNYSLNPATKQCDECKAPDVYVRSTKLCEKCPNIGCTKCNEFKPKSCDKCIVGYMDYTESINGIEYLRCKPKDFKAKNARFRQASEIIEIEFEDRVDKVEIDNLELQVTEAADNRPVRCELLGVEQRTENRTMLYLRINLLEDLFDGKILVTFKKVQLVKSIEDSKGDYMLSLLNQTVMVLPEPEKKTNTKIKSGSVAGLNAAGTVASNSMNIAMLLMMLLNFPIAIALMKIYQMMDFMLLYNVEYPMNLRRFLETFKGQNLMKYIPNYFTGLTDETCLEMGDKFIEQDMSCQFLSNAPDSLTIILCFFLLKFLVALLSRPFLQGDGRLPRLCRYLNGITFGINGFFYLVGMFDMDFHLAAFTNSKYYFGDATLSPQNLFNVLLSNTYIYLFPMFVFWMYLKTKLMLQTLSGDQHLDDPTTQQLQFLIQDRKLANPYQKYYEVFKTFRNFVIAAIVVGFYDTPAIQIVGTFVAISVFFVLDVCNQAKVRALENVVEAVVWFCYAVCTALFASLIFFKDKLSRDNIYKYIGWPIIVCFIGIIIANFAPVFADLYLFFKGLCKKKKATDATDEEASRLNQSANKVVAKRGRQADIKSKKESKDRIPL